MTAATTSRQLAYRDGNTAGFSVAASTTIYAGTLIEMNASGYAIPATAGADKYYAGIALHDVDNSQGANGDITVVVRQWGTVLLLNNSTNPLDQANIGGYAYLVDDQTVDSISASRTPVGRTEAVDAEGVWVRLGHKL